MEHDPTGNDLVPRTLGYMSRVLLIRDLEAESFLANARLMLTFD